ncbi:Thiamine biosynthesis lipoprotein ApbE precursor [Hartmannibacter diazotrophicus]|uniref:FAD:protein FMN transferase n=1 Tax=Hartmannibacter diazotrophicus TaxID=1482074 RepID=A0A2C9DAR6_9HYPH|nr:FAD:protein FMN transferase [Hartmannibacter diazotrophicus]SON57260.1 Thiamine biosynthesis lipoprotein ApbE precursor [Hartmannibacter diazotrophicus]
MSKTSIDHNETAEPRRVSLNGPTMGSRWTAVWFDDGLDDPLEIGADLIAAVGAVDNQMSTWKPGSDLMRLNRAGTGSWIEVPANLATVLDVSLRIGRASGGAFNIGVGRAVAEWGFGSHAGRPGDLAGTPATLSMDLLDVDALRSRVLKHGPMSLDLSGIAKGFGVDELARVLDEAGIASYLVGIDGEMRARGEKPDGSPWSVALERPDPAVRAIHGVVTLSDCAVATSGDYRHWREDETGRISHTVDPRTGQPVCSRLASVTVLAPSAMAADAAATALMVMGEDEGLAYAERQGLEALMIVRTETGELAEHGTGRFAPEAAPSTGIHARQASLEA